MKTPQQSRLYAEPIHVDGPENCFFYHFMDLPELGTVGSTWDLRSCADRYLGNLDYSGQRVLDVGAASGFLTFEMEKRGADVVSFDMPSVESWNFVPHYKLKNGWEKMVTARATAHHQMQRAYWYAHRQLGSKARVHYGNVYELPLELGDFDVVFLGMILPHLRDPFQALYSASRLAAKRIVVTNPGRKPGFWSRILRRDRYVAKFLPAAENTKSDVWWALSNSCIERMLETLGFRIASRVPSSAPCHVNGKTRRRRSLAIVAERIAGRGAGIAVTGKGSVAAA